MDEAIVARHSSQAERFDRTRPEAISGAQPRRPIVMILGMHRTGTSLCSHILSMLGVDMADEIRPGSGNDHGHWERWELVAYHDRILELFNRGYASTLHDLPLPAAWWADPAVAAIRREMVTFLEQRMGRGHFGFKDPRTVRLMPLWHQICEELKLAPKIVLCVRDPAQVARSLQARDGLDRAVGEYRWLVHMVDFFRYAGGLEYCLIEYEKWFDNPRANVQRLRKFLGVQWQQSEADLDLILANLIDPKMRHDDHGHEEANLALARSLYHLVRHTDQDPDSREGVDEIVTQFIAVQQMQVPLQRAFERADAAAAKLPEYERQLAASQASIAERDVAIESARVNLESAAQAVKNAETEAAGLRTVVDDRDAALTAARSHSAEGENRLAAALAEIGNQRRQLSDRDAALRQAAARTAESETRMAAALADAEGQRGRLAQVELESDERLAALTVALSQQRAQIERERTKSAAATKALEAETASLREQVAAARQVGRELLAALHVDATAKSPPPPRAVKRSWWRRPFSRSLAAIHPT